MPLEVEKFLPDMRLRVCWRVCDATVLLRSVARPKVSKVTASPQIVTHDNPIRRAKTNFIHRLAIDDPPTDRFEQVWTYTEDRQSFELCCIPFFPYGVSVGDRLVIAEDGSFKVLQKSGHQTIRVVIHDDRYAHEQHAEFHRLIVATGARWETFGHAPKYWALDLDDAAHAQRLIDVLTPLSDARTLDWEWADPPHTPEGPLSRYQ